MTNATITDLEFKVLEVFAINCTDTNGAADADEMKGDNMTWTRPSEVRVALRIKAEAVGGLFTSLESKGLIADSGEQMVDGVSKPVKKNSDWTLTDAGIDAYFAAIGQEPTEAEQPAEPTAEVEQPTAEADNAHVAELLKHFGYDQPRNLCKAIRAAARVWLQEDLSRKSFLDGCEALGLNRANASAEWQAERKQMGL